jgi:hypothetical protein
MASLRRLTLAEHPRASAPALLALVVFAAWVGTGAGGSTVVRYVDDLATAAAALLATVACALAARRQAGRLALFWWLFAAAMGAWTLGEVLWARYDFGLAGGTPAVSWADVGYLGGIPLAAAALLVHPALRGRTAGKTRSVLDGLVVASALFFLSWTLLLGPLWHRTDLSTLAGLVTLAYPVGDAVLVLLIVLVIRGTSNRDRPDLWLLLVGLLATACSDVLYGYLVEVKQYSTGNLVDIGWFAGYLAIALGARAARPLEATQAAPRAATLSPAALVVPFVPMLGALGFAAVRMHLGHRLDRIGLVTAIALIVLVLLRQMLFAFDLASSRETGEALPDRMLVAVGSGTGRPH